ncbi:hypothetical protein CLU79DRAFT_159267 [Phycomyces nitens]|nr:hypothetical protein CLU79DRAFT_159267 [Phycomyces nitens]
MYPERQLSPSIPNSPRYTLPPITSPHSRQNMHPPQSPFNPNNIHRRPMDREPDPASLYKQHTPQFSSTSSESSTFVQMLAYNNSHQNNRGEKTGHTKPPAFNTHPPPSSIQYASTVQNTYSYHPYHECSSYATHETTKQAGESEKAHVATPWPPQYRTNNTAFEQPSSVSISTRSPTQTVTPEEGQQYGYSNINHYPRDNRWQEGEIIQATENTRTKKEREYNERVQEIEREFMENRRIIYQEKMEKVQEELNEVYNGRFDTE